MSAGFGKVPKYRLVEQKDRIIDSRRKIVGCYRKMEELGKRRFFRPKERQLQEIASEETARFALKIKDRAYPVECARMIQDMKAGVPVAEARKRLAKRNEMKVTRVCLKSLHAGQRIRVETEIQKRIDDGTAVPWKQRPVEMKKTEAHITDDVPLSKHVMIPTHREFEREEAQSLAAFRKEMGLDSSNPHIFSEETEGDLFGYDPEALLKHDLRTGVKRVFGERIPARRACREWTSTGYCHLGILCTFRHSYMHEDPRRSLGPLSDDSSSGEPFDENAD